MDERWRLNTIALSGWDRGMSWQQSKEIYLNSEIIRSPNNTGSNRYPALKSRR